VEALRSKGVEVVAFVRDPVKADSRLPGDGVQIVKGDLYQYSDVQNAVAGVDAVICAAGTNNFTDPFGPFVIDYTVRLHDAIDYTMRSFTLLFSRNFAVHDESQIE
jgi:uncharacterized protein YbjT (DUF2867 family)